MASHSRLSPDRAANLITGLRSTAEAVRAYGSNGRRDSIAHDIATEMHLLATELECDLRTAMSVDLASAQLINGIAIEGRPAHPAAASTSTWHVDVPPPPCFVPAAGTSMQERSAALSAAAGFVGRLADESRFVLATEAAPRRRQQLTDASRRIKELTASLCAAAGDEPGGVH